MALVLTSEQMRRSDRFAIDELGLPGILLMENAGRGTAGLIIERLARRRHQGSARVAVVCGAGQNGGDGFVIARHLAGAGHVVRVLLCLSRDKIKGDAAVNASVAEKLSAVAIEDLSQQSEPTIWDEHLAEANVVVDAIFGTGLRDDVRGVPAEAIAAINRRGVCPGVDVVAVDVPSGLAADTGEVQGDAVRAHATATMGARKAGLVIDPGAPVGDVHVVDLGAPVHAPQAQGPYVHLTAEDEVRARVPRPQAGAHKGSRGHALVIAGSPGKTGAAVLAATGALRAGAGLVTVASARAGQAALEQKIVEAMSASYTDGDDADEASYARLEEAFAARAAAAAVGPGIPTGPGTCALVEALAARWPGPLVLDADALNALGDRFGTLLSRAPAARILTPHPGEAARLLGIGTGEVQGDRVAVARRLARDSGAVVILKGARSLIAEPDGNLHVNPAADPALATAGSGDVLTGTVAALLAQGLSPADAAVVGAYIHGEAAAEATRCLQTNRLTAADLPLAIARVLARL